MTEDMISDIRAAQREKHWLQASPATIGDYPFGAVVLNLFGAKKPESFQALGSE